MCARGSLKLNFALLYCSGGGNGSVGLRGHALCERVSQGRIPSSRYCAQCESKYIITSVTLLPLDQRPAVLW